MAEKKIVTENEMENDLNKVAEVYWDLYKNYEKGDTELNKAIDDWAGRRYLGNSIDSKLRYAQYISQEALDILTTKNYDGLKNGNFRSEHVIPKEKHIFEKIRKIVTDDTINQENKEKQVKEIIKKRHRICLITAEQDKKIALKDTLPEDIANSLEKDPTKEMEREDEFSRYKECGGFEGQKIYKIKGFTKNYSDKKYEIEDKIDVVEYFTIPKKS